MLNGSGILDKANQTIATAAGANDRSAPIASNIIGSVFNLFLINAIGKQKNEIGVALASGLHSRFENQLDVVEQFIANQLSDGVVTGSLSQKVSVCIQECRVALENEDYDALLKASSELEKAFEKKTTTAEKSEKEWKHQQTSLNRFITLLSAARMMIRLEAGSSTHVVQG